MDISANLYSLTNQPQTNDAIAMAKSSNEKKFDIIVDIGSGTGNVTLNVVAKHFECEKIFGYDIDPSMIDFAKRENSHEKISYEIANFEQNWENLPKSLQNLEGMVDLVWSNHTLHWIINKPQLGMTIGKLLKKGGTFLANASLINEDVFRFLTTDLMEPEGKIIWKNEMTNDEQKNNWESIFLKCGFSYLNVELKEFFGELPSPKHLQAFLPVFFNIAKKNVLNLNEFEKLSNHSQNLVKDFIYRTLLSKLGEPPKESMDYEEKGYFYGSFIINGIK